MGAILQVDTRQQLGKHTMKNRWFEGHGIQTVSMALPYGDYRVAGSNVVVDTKRDVDELAANLGRDHGRFTRECDRAAADGNRLWVLIEQHPEYEDRERLAEWVSHPCRRCWALRRGECEPNESGHCINGSYRRKPMTGARLASMLPTMTSHHGVMFRFCDRRDSARIICELLGIQMGGDTVGGG